jgi:hypothetical protein
MHSSCTVFQYAVKSVCGIAPIVDHFYQTEMAPGQYFTAINIFNPANCKAVTFSWRVVDARSISGRPGPVNAPQHYTLRPGQGVEIDARDILGERPELRKGFVVIESPCELDIVAVYSASPPPPSGSPIGPLVAFHTERVPARKICPCEDLTLDLSTGVAEWTLVSAVDLNNIPFPSLMTPRPAAVVEDVAHWPSWALQPGTKWISVTPFPVASANSNVPGSVPGVYTFETTFTLCAGFEAASLQLDTLIDDSADVFLNNNAVGSLLGNWTGPIYHAPPITSGFLPGVNRLTFAVRNRNAPPPNPMGMNARVRLQAAKGACPDGGCECGCG